MRIIGRRMNFDTLTCNNLNHESSFVQDRNVK